MKNIDLIDLPYEQNLHERYSNLCNLSGFVLLESTDKIRGRYDILSAYPYETLIVDKNNLATLSLLEKKMKPIDYGLNLPFQGGAIGYFSYDLAVNMMELTHHQENLINMPDAIIGFYDWAIITDHHLKKVTVFAANTQQNTPLIIKKILKKWPKISAKFPAFSLLSEVNFLVNKRQYLDAFHHILANIKKGRCYQVNYTQLFHAFYEGSLWNLYSTIKKLNPVPYSAYLPYKQGNILSFSPERFLLMDKHSLLTSPIKGSRKRSSIPNIDDELGKALVASEKDRAENVMIVDLLRNDLGKIAKTGTVEVNNLFSLESYEKVHHLVSHIYAECREQISPIEAFLSCFPGGSITGAPKREAMKVIAEQELYSRGIYCGCIGYFSNHGRFDTNIAIRTMIAKEQQLYLAAGGGIVFDSLAEEEYAECFTKIAAILQGLSESDHD